MNVAAPLPARFKVWADPYIEVGGEWRRDISTALSRTCVGVLLVSGNFLASDFIYDEELPALLAGVVAGDIILRFPSVHPATTKRLWHGSSLLTLRTNRSTVCLRINAMPCWSRSLSRSPPLRERPPI